MSVAVIFDDDDDQCGFRWTRADSEEELNRLASRADFITVVLVDEAEEAIEALTAAVLEGLL